MKCSRFFILLILFIIAGTTLLQAETRSLWATAWDINTPQKIVKVVKTAAEHDFDAIFAEIRYRGDALYKPNRYDRTFPNPEPISYFVTIDGFDPLAFLLQTAQNFNIKVYAWMTTFVVTPLYTNKLPEDHVYFTHPEWICRTNSNEPMISHTLAFLKCSDIHRMSFLMWLQIMISTELFLIIFAIRVVNIPTIHLPSNTSSMMCQKIIIQIIILNGSKRSSRISFGKPVLKSNFSNRMWILLQLPSQIITMQNTVFIKTGKNGFSLKNLIMFT